MPKLPITLEDVKPPQALVDQLTNWLKRKVLGPPSGEELGMLAQYKNPGELLHAAEKVHGAGYKSFDTHSPFPIHGMDAAMGLGQSKLGWIVLGMALTGFTIAWALQGWTSAIDYPLVLSLSYFLRPICGCDG